MTMRVLAALLLVMTALPAHADRVCQRTGNATTCSDGTYLPKSETKPPPKDGTFEYHQNGTVCQVFGKVRYCR